MYADRLSRDGKSDESATCDWRWLTLHNIRSLFPSFHERLSSPPSDTGFNPLEAHRSSREISDPVERDFSNNLSNSPLEKTDFSQTDVNDNGTAEDRIYLFLISPFN